MEKCFEDARQDEKHVPDLLESIMRPTDPLKEELRQKLFKIDQFGSKITKNMGLHFSDLRKNRVFGQRSLRGPILTPFLQYLAPLGAKYMEKRPKNIKNAGYSPLGLVTLVCWHSSMLDKP